MLSTNVNMSASTKQTADAVNLAALIVTRITELIHVAMSATA